MDHAGSRPPLRAIDTDASFSALPRDQGLLTLIVCCDIIKAAKSAELLEVQSEKTSSAGKI